MESKNLLAMIPVRKQNIMLEKTQEQPEIYSVCIPRTNFLERLSIKFLKQPAYHRVQLDNLGSFVLRLCDGLNRVEEIEQKVENQFGEKAAPIRERLLAFLTILETNDWIMWREP